MQVIVPTRMDETEMGEAYIYDAVRTPRGKGRAKSGEKPGGGLSELRPHELERADKQLGMVVASAANGIGSALIIERC